MLHRVLFSLVLLLFSVASTASAQLVAHWDFEEGSGDTTKNQITGDLDPLTDTMWLTDSALLPPVVGGSTAALSLNGV